jgi:predicted nuclease of restriction endonuclease-like RecB superfamily
MLPIELLRVRISSKLNQIRPIFYDSQEKNQLLLVVKLVKMFEQMGTEGVSKAKLDENILEIEAKYTDYKLVRGICHLLEQRCVYALPGRTFPHGGNNNAMNAINLRRKIFEESSRNGYPATEDERKQILQKFATESNLTTDELEIAIWADLDKNKYLKNFESLSPLQLISWYNISILQSLLLNCIKLEFSVYGGFSWKKILRKIKQLGLMYFLFQENYLESESNKQTRNQEMIFNSKKDKRVICTVEGPLSIVRLTDKYGTAMAKLIPLIIFTDIWSIDAIILRKSISGVRKTYRFQISNKDKDLPLFDASKVQPQSESNMDSGSIYKNAIDNFDSIVEKKFMDKFLKFSIGWNLIREPDPLILSNGKAFIPDFVFEKYGIKVYLEIVGFWTSEYLKRKFEKIKDLLNTKSGTSVGADLLIVANIDNYISENGDKIMIDSIFSEYIGSNNLIFYKKDQIPFGPIIKYLKDIDSRIIDDISINFNNSIVKELESIIEDKQNKIIFLKQVSDKQNIPVESVLKTIRNLQSNNDASTTAIKNRLKGFLLLDNYLISNDKIDELLPEFDKLKKLPDAVRFLGQNNIPEECIISLIPKIGFEIVWNGIDFNDALIKRKLIDD